MGNLLIFEDDKKQKGRTFGRLIDYDHAKKAPGTCEVPSKIPSSSLKGKRDFLRLSFENLSEREAADDVLDTALKWMGPIFALPYINGVADSLGLSNDASLNMEDLRWYNIVSRPPF